MRSRVTPTQAVRAMVSGTAHKKVTSGEKPEGVPEQEPGHEERDVRAHHEHVAVGEVDQPQDAVHQGVTQRDQGVEAAPLERVEYVLNYEVHFVYSRENMFGPLGELPN